jgi:hypothetical protein
MCQDAKAVLILALLLVIDSDPVLLRKRRKQSPTNTQEPAADPPPDDLDPPNEAQVDVNDEDLIAIFDGTKTTTELFAL